VSREAGRAGAVSGPLGDGELIASIIGQLAKAQAFLASGKVPASKFAEAAWNEARTHYRVKRSFGSEVTYEAVWIAPEARCRCHAGPAASAA